MSPFFLDRLFEQFCQGARIRLCESPVHRVAARVPRFFSLP